MGIQSICRAENLFKQMIFMRLYIPESVGIKSNVSLQHISKCIVEYMLFHWAWALEVLPSNLTTATVLFLDTHNA